MQLFIVDAATTPHRRQNSRVSGLVGAKSGISEVAADPCPTLGTGPRGGLVPLPATGRYDSEADGHGAAGCAYLHGRDDAHAKIGAVGSGHFGGLLISMRASNQTSARKGIINDSK